MYSTKTRQFLAKALMLGLIYLSTINGAIAQESSTTATINGVVTDEQGATISGAKVTIINLNSNITREISSQEDGTYSVSQLPPGNYKITIQSEGFKTVSANLELELGIKAKIDTSLTLGQVNDVVLVESSSALQDGKTENSTNVGIRNIDGLPINRRNFLDFSLTTPRVVADSLPQQGIIPTSGLSFNGQSARLNNFTVDGVDNNDSGSGAVRTTFSQDAVQEFQVVSDSYSAEFGRAVGGIVNIVTKGGTNDFHGKLFFLNRNDSISARNAFARINPEFKQYQFGAITSGPIKKDKIFYFTSFERLSIKQNNIVTISDQTVASAQRLGFNISNGPLPFSVATTSFLSRADIEITPSNKLSVRYSFGGNYNGAIETFGGLTSDTSSGVERVKDNTIAINNTYISNALGLVNETRVIYYHRRRSLTESSNLTQVNLIAPEGNVIYGRNFFVPQPDRLQTATQIINNVSLTRGRNFIKFGIDALLSDGSASLPFAGAGQGIFRPINFATLAGFPTFPTISGPALFDPSLRTPAEKAFLTFFASVLPNAVPGFPQGVPLANLSIPLAYVQGFGFGKIGLSTNLFSAFVQNEIRLKPSLLVKAGVRYDINRQDFTPDNSGNFSPRLAISYKARKDLVIRAGYGIFFGTLGPAFAFPTRLLTSKTVQLLVVPFPFSVFPFALPDHRLPISSSSNFPAGVPAIKQLSTELQIQPDLRNNYSQQATFGIDYYVTKDTLLSVNYNYTRGNKVIAYRNINPIVRPVSDPVTNAIVGRVDTSRGDVFEFESAFDSYFHGVTISLNRRVVNRLSLLAHYTLSKAIDNSVDINFAITASENPLRPDLERSLSLQDVRSRFVTSAVVDLDYKNNPFSKGLQFSTIVTLNSGKPYNLLAGVDLNSSGDLPPFDRPAHLGRNAGIKPGFANIDLRLQKGINLRENIRLEGFLEIFNAFNRTNISEVDGTYPPDAQGNFQLPSKDGSRFIAPTDRFRSSFAPRQLQFGFKISF